MNRAWLAAPLLALSACAAPTDPGSQTATVTIGQGTCEINTTALKPVTTVLNIRNITAKAGQFVITEDEGRTVVGRADVEPGSMEALTVHFDAADVYQLKCGDVLGPEIHPQG